MLKEMIVCSEAEKEEAERGPRDTVSLCNVESKALRIISNQPLLHAETAL